MSKLTSGVQDCPKVHAAHDGLAGTLDQMPTETLEDAPAHASTAVAATLVSGGIAFDIAAHAHIPSVSSTLFVALVAAALWRLTDDRARRFALVAALSLSVFLTFRASESLAILDLFAIAVLLACAASSDLGELASLTITRAIVAAFASIDHALHAPAFLVRPVLPALHRLRSVRGTGMLRTAAIVVPVVIVFASLLAAADRVFADLVTPALPRLPFADVAGHIVLIAAGTWGLAALWRSAVAPRLPMPSDGAPRRPSLGRTEWITVLAAIDVLFALFVAVQFAVLFGGRMNVEVTPGLTYAEYARSGFFQLLAVALLTEIVIVTTWDLGIRSGRGPEKIYRTLVGAMIALSGVIVISAMIRLRLYQSAFGFTVNRLVAMIAIIAIAAILVATFVLIVLARRERLLSTVLACAVAGLIAFNLVNPDAFVARHNVERFRKTGRIDVGYLGALGADATPVTVRVLEGAPDGTLLREALCRTHPLFDGDTTMDLNVARRAALKALLAHGLDAETCGRTPPE